MEPSTREKRLFIFYEFSRGASSTETFENVQTVFGEACPTFRTVQHWFSKFSDGDLNIDDAPRSGRPKEVDTGLIQRAIETNPTATTRELAEGIGCSHVTIENELHSLGMKPVGAP